MTEPDAITDARHKLGAHLAAYRRAAGYNQSRFAPLTGYGRSTIANVETGRQRVPRDFWRRCDEALGTGGALLAEFGSVDAMERRLRREHADAQKLFRAEAAERQLAAIASGDAARLPPGSETGYWPGSADQARKDAPALWTRELSVSATADDQLPAMALRWLVAPGEAPPGQVAGWRRIGPGDVERMRAIGRHLKSIDNAHGGGTAFPMAATFLRREVAPLLEASYTDATARLLLAATAEVVLDVGWMAYDANDHALARRYMAQALRLSHACGDRMFGGRVLAAMSHQALHLGQVRLAIDLARAARSGTAQLATPTVGAMLGSMEACAQAAAGNRALCVAALTDAESALGRAHSGDDDPAWLDFDEGGLWGHAARAFRDLRCTAEAENYARQAVVLCHAQHDRTRAQRNAILATACLQRGDADQAAALGLTIIDDAWRLQSRHVDEDVATLAQQLRVTGTTAASDFLEHARVLFSARQGAATR